MADTNLDGDIKELQIESDAILAAQTEFIGRFYQNILNRNADQGGLDNWLSIIQSESGAKVALGFFNSQEFINLQLNNSDFVNILYSTLFDRLADQGGFDIWMAELEADTLRDIVIYGFLKSQEFSNLASSFNVTAFNEADNKLFQIKGFVRRFYQLVLNREPDSFGFNDWVSQLSVGTKAGGEIAVGFFNSSEFLNRDTTDSEFVDIAYRSFFGREADEAGKFNWLELLSAGSTRLEVISGFIDSQEFISLAASFGIEASVERFTADMIQNKTFYIVNESMYNKITLSFQEVTYITISLDGRVDSDSSNTFFIDNDGSINMGTDELALKLQSSSNEEFLQVLAVRDSNEWKLSSDYDETSDINELKRYFLTNGLWVTNITQEGVVRKYSPSTLVDGKWWVEDNVFYFDFPNDNTGGLDAKAYKIEDNKLYFATDAKSSHTYRMYYDEIKAGNYYNQLLNQLR